MSKTSSDQEMSEREKEISEQLERLGFKAPAFVGETYEREDGTIVSVDYIPDESDGKLEP